MLEPLGWIRKKDRTLRIATIVEGTREAHCVPHFQSEQLLFNRRKYPDRDAAGDPRVKRSTKAIYARRTDEEAIRRRL